MKKVDTELTDKKNNQKSQQISPALTRRKWKFRICGSAVCAFAVWICSAGNWHTVPVSIGTVVLIIGIAIFMTGSPEDYNAMTDVGAMIAMDRPRKIEEFYEAYKNVKTPLGSGWLGRFSTSPYTSLIFGPDARGQFIYFWLTGDGSIGYIGYSFLEGTITKKINEPLIPCEKEFCANTAEHLCYHSDIFMTQSWLKESMEYFVKNGEVLPFRESKTSEVYTFTEDFKLAGQHFELRDENDNLIYVVEGTDPLINLRIYDTQQTEVFRMTKKIGHALATYSFYYKGEPYGVLKKKFALVRDTFAMDIKEGRLELIEYAGTIGHNFKVTLNGKVLGAIMDDMDITWENVFFDNAFIIAYEKEYLPLLTAMAVMVARELARDQEGGATNWE